MGFLTLARIARELSKLLDRPAHLVPQRGLKPILHDRVLGEANLGNPIPELN